MACTVGCLVHGGDITIETSATIVIGQVLAELTAADSGQPRTYIVGVGQLVATTAMQLLGGYSSYIIVSISGKSHGTAAVQLVGNAADAVAMVVCVGKMTSCSSRHR